MALRKGSLVTRIESDYDSKGFDWFGKLSNCTWPAKIISITRKWSKTRDLVDLSTGYSFPLEMLKQYKKGDKL